MISELPQAILFDWDGTLVNTLGGLREAHNYVRERHGLKIWSEDEFLANIKFSSREIYPRIYGDKAAQAMDMLYSFLGERHLEHLEVLPHAEDLVRYIHGAGVPMGIVSNKKHEVIEREVRHLGWADMFFCVLGAGMAAKDKPAADPIFMALEKCMGPLDHSRVWFVGDTETDMLAAREAGCPAILITHGADRQALIDAYRPIFVVENCGALRNILENNGGEVQNSSC